MMGDLAKIFLWLYLGWKLETGMGSGNFNYKQEQDFIFLRDRNIRITG